MKKNESRERARVHTHGASTHTHTRTHVYAFVCTYTDTSSERRERIWGGEACHVPTVYERSRTRCFPREGRRRVNYFFFSFLYRHGYAYQRICKFRDHRSCSSIVRAFEQKSDASEKEKESFKSIRVIRVKYDKPYSWIRYSVHRSLQI